MIDLLLNEYKDHNQKYTYKKNQIGNISHDL